MEGLPTDEHIRDLVGSPLKADTVSEMTDDTKIYIYTGSETGYTAGHWYYYNGSSWEDGGVYNSAGINTDKTLSVEDKAADGKAVGDELTDLKSDLNQNYFTPKIAGLGNIDITTGDVATNAQYSYSEYIDISDYKKLVTDAQYESAFNAFYDSGLNFLSQFTVRTGSGFTIVPPDNAVYIRVSAATEKYQDTNKFRSLSRINTERINDLDESVAKLANSGDTFTPAIEGVGNISVQTGEVEATADYSHSDYIDISDFNKLTTNGLYGSAFNAFYAADKTFISAFAVVSGINQTISIPDNAVYMRISSPTERYTDTFIFSSLSHTNAQRINSLESDVAELSEQGTDYFTPPIIGTGNISRSDGSVVVNAQYSVSDYIDISDFNVLTTNAQYESAFNAFYNANKEFISAFVVRAGSNIAISVPDNAVYIRVSADTPKYKDTFIFRALSHANAVRIADVEEAMSSMADQGTDYFTPPIVSTGYISRDTGEAVADGSYSRSDYVDISCFKQLTTYATVSGSFNAFYNASKEFISAFVVRVGNGLTVEIPENAVYMRVSTGTASYNNTYIFKALPRSNAERINDLEDAIDTLSDGESSYFTPKIAGNGNVNINDGTISSSTYYYSEYIDISQYPSIFTLALYDSSFNAFYDANKVFISSFVIRTGEDKLIIPPVGAMYMRVSADKAKYNDTMRFRTLEYVTSDLLPDYWMAHIIGKCKTLRDRMATIGKFGETFAFVTDIHWNSNQRKSPKLIKYLLNHLNINMVVLGGDLITEGEKEAELIESLNCIKAFRFPDVFVPMTFGNHDNNSNQSEASYRFDNNTVYSLFFKGFEDQVTFMTDTESSFYFDKGINKTRYIFLDMGDDGVSRPFSAFAEFRDALLSTPNGYKIVIVAHIIDYGTFTTSLTQMIDAYNARTSVTVNGVVCDFTSASGSVIICLGGHRHYDAETTTSGGVPITLTDCDAMLSVTEITEVAGTITEQAFDVVSLDYTNMIAYYERIGRGNSRIIHMTPVSASTALTTILTGTITWTSSNTSVATVNNGTITRLTSGTVVIKADNGTASEVWVCNS